MPAIKSWRGWRPVRSGPGAGWSDGWPLSTPLHWAVNTFVKALCALAPIIESFTNNKSPTSGVAKRDCVVSPLAHPLVGVGWVAYYAPPWRGHPRLRHWWLSSCTLLSAVEAAQFEVTDGKKEIVTTLSITVWWWWLLSLHLYGSEGDSWSD